MPRLKGFWIHALLCLSMLGCAGLPVSNPLPAGTTIEPVVTAAQAPFAADPAGEQLAFVRNGLVLAKVIPKHEQQISASTPVALAWSPDGTRLAAAFPATSKSQIRLYDATGKILAETELNGATGDLAWRSTQELLIAQVVKSDYAFGSDFQQLLTKWDGVGQPESIRVHNATLRPGTARKLGDNYAQAFKLAVNPFGDEIAFTRQHDPPEFNTYLRVMLRHLDAGSERELVNIAQGSNAPTFIGSEDQLVVVDGKSISRLKIWQSKDLTRLPFAGRHIAASPGGRYLLIDNQLTQGDKIITRFPEDVTGHFAAQGSRLFILHDGTIYLVKGLAADPLTIPNGAALENILTLRKLRSQGLITNEDYLKSMAK